MAMNQALGNNQQLLLEATVELIKLGFMRRNKNDDKMDDSVVANEPTLYDPNEADVEVQGVEKPTKH
jgi:hypothetical protein